MKASMKMEMEVDLEADIDLAVFNQDAAAYPVPQPRFGRRSGGRVRVHAGR